ncbi:MAG TPA: SET domain-containing protein-lysine N-methyltransferase [Thermoanaerobaculia bacterium]
MRICILSDVYRDTDSPLAAVAPAADPSRWLDGHELVRVDLAKATAVREVTRLARQGFDVFFNLCDGAWDEDRPGIEVVEALERLGVAYTGPTPVFYEPSRDAMKRVCHAWDIATPPGVEVREEADLARALATLRFPLIVKHPSSYSSIGMTRDSLVETPEALAAEVARFVATFGGALVEEFIAGREVSVLVAENPDDPNRPTVYPPVEIVFPPGETFKHFDVKWREGDRMDCRPLADAALAARVADEAAKLFLDLGGTGWGRCDVRVDAGGRTWMLEINPNAAVFYPPDDPSTGDAILALVPGGHRAFALQMLAAAVARRDRRRPAWVVRADREGNYATYAARAIRAGETIQVFEERPHTLVTRRHVEEHWAPREREWFERFAWPLSDEVWAIWSPDPGEWAPIDHSCDPSAWLDGLDVTARRDIAPGDEITLDYATFCTEPMRAFPCACGAADCRGTIRGSDHLGPFVERYGDHVSDHVRRKREEAGVAGEAEVAGGRVRALATRRVRRARRG